MNIEIIKQDKITTDCEKHGNSAEALMNGKCRNCYKEQKNKIISDNLESITKKCIVNSNIDTRYYNSTFNNYIATSEEQKQAVTTLQNWNNTSNILLSGKTGNGKTHLICALINKLLSEYVTNNYTKDSRLKEKGVFINLKSPIQYWKYYELQNLKIRKEEIYDEKIRKSPILAIDEIGITTNEKRSELLHEIIDYRYSNELPTIIITNLVITELKTVLLEATQSRIREDFIIITTNWEDYRNKNLKIT
jgi:DNA replication protein DnaC/putative replication protein